jgi:hypothetical protein
VDKKNKNMNNKQFTPFPHFSFSPFPLFKAAVLFCLAVVFISCNQNKEESTLPGKAVVTGEAANSCPSISVTLSASAEGALSYIWYRNGNAISAATGPTYDAVSSGTYQAAGVNKAGAGEKSESKAVTVTTNCPPSVPVISGTAANVCPSQTVRLTATATNAESYVWYKDNTVLSGATNTSYEASAAGAYSVEAHNSYGSSSRSDVHTVTIIECPPEVPAISGSTINVCPASTVALTATSANATSYQWYWYGDAIAGATASTYLVTRTGAYYVTASNDIGTSEKQSEGYTVYIDLCAAQFNYTDLLGDYAASGKPNGYPESHGPGPASWTSSITQPTDGSTAEYVVSSFADFDIDDAFPPFYISVGQNEDRSKVGFAVDMTLPLFTDTYTDEETGATTSFYAHFGAFFVDDANRRWVFTKDRNQWWQLFWDADTQTLDFSAVYIHEGKEYDVTVGILAYNEAGQYSGMFSECYINCRYVKGASGAAAFTGEKVSGLPRFNRQSPVPDPLQTISIKFDPTKLKRKL